MKCRKQIPNVPCVMIRTRRIQVHPSSPPAILDPVPHLCSPALREFATAHTRDIGLAMEYVPQWRHSPLLVAADYTAG